MKSQPQHILHTSHIRRSCRAGRQRRSKRQSSRGGPTGRLRTPRLVWHQHRPADSAIDMEEAPSIQETTLPLISLQDLGLELREHMQSVYSREHHNFDAASIVMTENWWGELHADKCRKRAMVLTSKLQVILNKLRPPRNAPEGLGPRRKRRIAKLNRNDHETTSPLQKTASMELHQNRAWLCLTFLSCRLNSTFMNYGTELKMLPDAQVITGPSAAIQAEPDQSPTPNTRHRLCYMTVDDFKTLTGARSGTSPEKEYGMPQGQLLSVGQSGNITAIHTNTGRDFTNTHSSTYQDRINKVALSDRTNTPQQIDHIHQREVALLASSYPHTSCRQSPHPQQLLPPDNCATVKLGGQASSACPKQRPCHCDTECKLQPAVSIHAGNLAATPIMVCTQLGDQNSSKFLRRHACVRDNTHDKDCGRGDDHPTAHCKRL